MLFITTGAQGAYQDISESSYQGAINAVTAIGIMQTASDTSFEPNRAVTRAEAVSAAIRLIGAQSISYGGEQAFYDVNASNPYYNEINTAYLIGLINGYEERMFSPDSTVKYEETVKIIVNTLGYRDSAEAKGGYPTGYMLTAASIGLTKGVSISEEFTREKLAKMLFNTFTIPYRSILGINNGQIVYSGTKASVLEEVWKTKKYQGKLLGIGEYILTTDNPLRENQIIIDGTAYDATYNIPLEYLGYKVIYYLKTDPDTRDTVLYVEPAFEPKTLKITNDDIDSFGNNELIYKDASGNRKKVSVPSYATVILNGKLAPRFTDDDFYTADEILCIDTESNGKFDLFKIENSQIFLVGGVDTTTKTIYDFYNRNIVIPENDIIKISSANGGTLNLEDLKSDDVLTIKATKSYTGLELYSIIVSDNKFEGLVEEKSETDDYTYVVIAGKEYRFSKNLEYIADGLTVNDSKQFFIDSYGRIAGYKNAVERAETYGYLIASSKDKRLDRDFTLKIFSQDDKIEYLPLSDKYYVNDVLQTSYQAISDFFLANPNGGVVKYNTNSSGEIKNLYTPVVKNTPNGDSKGLFLNFQNFAGNFKRNINSFGPTGAAKVRGSGTSVIFDFGAPNFVYSDDESYTLKYIDYFEDSSSYTIDAYDCSDVNIANVIVIKSGSGSTGIRKDTALMVVDKISVTTLEDVGEVYKISGMQNGTDVSVIVNENVDLTPSYMVDNVNYTSSLLRGDLIRYSLDKFNRVNAVEKIFSLTDKDLPNSNATWPSLAVSTDAYTPNGYNKFDYSTGGYRVVFATVKEKEGGDIIALVDGDEQVFDTNKMKIYIIDEEKLSFGTTTHSSIIPASAVNYDYNAASKVIIRTKDSEMREMFIIKRKN